LPGFKAGGPVQSLANLIVTLGSDYQFFVVTGAYDVDESEPYKNIQLNSWNELKLEENTVNVFYAGKKIDYTNYHQKLKEIAADYIFFNCMYSYRFFLFPLLNKNKLFAAAEKLIISPRGVLQPGSLAVKSFKKKMYLFLLRKSRLLSDCNWHATATSESDAIIKYFGRNSNIEIIGNVPKVPLQFITASTKQTGVLKLIHLSLITPVKNIQQLIQVCKNCKQLIIVDIYGPVKDADYWNTCIEEMKQLPNNVVVEYKGDLQPSLVQTTISKYDALILLTKGENFGHALFESLSVGRPIITSFFTPWINLQQKKAGWNVNIKDATEITVLLDQLALMDAISWTQYCDNAHTLSKEYFYNQSNLLHLYKMLFVKNIT
jgi:glycosyltransferase involved in cell wall biosynthesis